MSSLKAYRKQIRQRKHALNVNISKLVHHSRTGVHPRTERSVVKWLIVGAALGFLGERLSKSKNPLSRYFRASTRTLFKELKRSATVLVRFSSLILISKAKEKLFVNERTDPPI